MAAIQGELEPWADGFTIEGDEIDALLNNSYRVLHEVIERVDALRAAGYRPGALQVTPAGLEITIEPLP